jgi:hypothetical protein
MSVIIVILAAIALALMLFRVAHGSAAKIGSVDDLQGLTESLDLPAFLNLADPAEEEFLRTNLSRQDFRRVQRQRLRAAGEYVKCAARNAAVLLRLGELVSVEPSTEVSSIGKEMATAAIRLRVLAFFALGLLYVKMVFPAARCSLLQVSSVYQNLTGQVGRLARLKTPGEASRILRAL